MKHRLSGVTTRCLTLLTATSVVIMGQRPAFSQEEPVALQEVVVGESAAGPVDGYVAKRTATASKTDALIIETPQAINIITADQIADQGAETLSEAVRYTPGVTSGFEGAGDTRRDPINIRGFESMQYVDGLLLPAGNVTYGISKIEPYGMERIEVLKGPASVLYGQNAPGGLINMVTKRPTEEARGEVVLDGGLGAGAFEQLQGQVDVSGPIDAENTLLYRFIGLARNANTMVDDQPDDRLFLAPSLTWKPTEDTTITWLNQFIKDNGGVYQALPAEGTLQPNPNGMIPISRNLGEPGYDRFKAESWSTGYLLDHNFSEDITFSQTARYGHYRDSYAGVYLYDLQENLRIADRTAYAYRTQVDAFSIDNWLGFKFDTAAISHSALVGLDFTYTDYGDQFGDALPESEGGDVPPLDVFEPVYPGYSSDFPLYYQTASTWKNWGLYAQDIIRYENFTLMAGIRHDWAYDRTTGTDTNINEVSVAEQDPQATTYRFGAVYQFENGLAPYMSYSESFQLVPGYTSYDQLFVPTTGQQYEVGLRYAIPDTDMMVTLSAFDLYQQNLVGPDPDDPFNSIQNGEINVKGVELEAKANLESGWNIAGGLSYLDGQVTESTIAGQIGAEAARTPDWMASMWVEHEFNRNGPLGGLTIGGGVRYVGSFYSFQNEDDTGPKVPETTLFDAHLEYDFSAIDEKYNGVILNVTATNIFNEVNYAAVDADYVTLGPGREVLANLAYRW